MFSSCREWGCEGDDAAGAEDAPHTQAGKHCGAEGGIPAPGKTLPGVWVCGEGTRREAALWDSSVKLNSVNLILARQLFGDIHYWQCKWSQRCLHTNNAHTQ